MTNDEQQFWKMAYLKAMETQNPLAPLRAADLALIEYREANAKWKAPEPARGGDPLDIAYLAMGAQTEWEIATAQNNNQLPDALDGLGQDNVISDVILAAPLLAEAWRQIEPHWRGGVWVYEIAEELGAWIIQQWVILGHKPDNSAIQAELSNLINESQTRHD